MPETVNIILVSTYTLNVGLFITYLTVYDYVRA